GEGKGVEDPEAVARSAIFAGSLARDHASPESTLVLVKAASLACGRSRPLTWCPRPRKRATSPARPLPLRTRRDRDKQAAVVVVGGEEISGDRLPLAGARAQLEPLAESSYTPLECELRGIAAVFVARQNEAVHDLSAHQLVLSVTRQLEDAPSGGENPALLVADDKAGTGSRVVVVQQLEQEAEPAAVTRDRLPGQAFLAVVVDRPFPTVRADEIRHEMMVETGGGLRSIQRDGAGLEARAGRVSATAAPSTGGAGRRRSSRASGRTQAARWS